jgi:hypothetical protein
MDANSLRELLDKDAAGWQRITAYLEANLEGRVHGDDADPWTSADLYAHLARWLDHTSDLLEAQRDGTPKPQEDGTIDEINARFRAEDAGIDITTARPRAVAAHDRYISAVSSLPLDRWNQELESDAMYDGWDHYDQHLNYIEGRT